MSVYREPTPNVESGGADTPTPPETSLDIHYSSFDPNHEAVQRKRRRFAIGASTLAMAGILFGVAKFSAGRETPSEASPSITATAAETTSHTPSIEISTPPTVETPPGWREGKVMLVHQPEHFQLTYNRMPTKEDIPELFAHTFNSLANYDVLNGGVANPPATIDELKEIAKNAGISLDDRLWRIIEEDRKPNIKRSYTSDGRLGSSYTVNPTLVEGLGPNPDYEGIKSELYPNVPLQLHKGRLKTYDPENTVMYEPVGEDLTDIAKGGSGLINATVIWDSKTGALKLNFTTGKEPFKFAKDK